MVKKITYPPTASEQNGNVTKANNITLDRTKVLSATHRPDGSVATVITKSPYSGQPESLIQYGPDGSVTFVEKLDHLGGLIPPPSITYRKDGTVSSITRTENYLEGTRTVALYDENGCVSANISLNKDDQVNFKDGVISSLIKYTGMSIFGASDMDETQYGPDGKIISSVHKVRYSQEYNLNNGGKWLTTSETTYYPNGHKASTITYKQKTKMKREDGRFLEDKEKEEEADSYRSSIIQYDENGKVTVSVKLNEQDEVNYNGDKIATITRRDKDNNLLSTTNYDENGKIASLQNYDKSGKIISSVSYENGRPVSSSQPQAEGFGDIFSAPKPKKNTVKKGALKETLKDGASKGKQAPKRLQQKTVEK